MLKLREIKFLTVPYFTVNNLKDAGRKLHSDHFIFHVFEVIDILYTKNYAILS